MHYLTAEKRKQKTNEFLKALMVPTLEDLPLCEDFTNAQFRPAKEIAERCFVLAVIHFVAHGEVSAEEAREYLADDLWNRASPSEKEFLMNEKPSKQDIIDFSWRIEGLYVLLWSLGKFDELGLPIEMCDMGHIEDPPDFTGEPEEWIAKATLRNTEEILDQVDLIYRIHWATRDAELNGDKTPGNFDPGIVFERHHALNWLVMTEDEWDDVTTDT
jgi:hypothetical protein